MNVWAVIPHFGPPEPTLELLDELRSATVAPARVVVVDNDGGLALDDDETVRVLRPGFNSGYGAAVAAASDAALAAAADWLWVLNNDARPAADCLERLLEAGAAAPRAGILSAVIRYRSGGDIWYAGGTVSPRTLEVRHLHAVRGRRPYWTGFITGCAPLLRAALVRELSPLDDGLFMYYEDVDWSLRALEHRWGLLVVPGAEVVHDVRREGGRRVFSDAAVYYMVRNRLLVARLRGGLAPAAAAGLASPTAVGTLAPPAGAGALWGLRQAAKSRSLPEARRRLAACGRGLRDGFAGRRGPAHGIGEGGTS